jgi:phosphate/sulfate permease
LGSTLRNQKGRGGFLGFIADLARAVLKDLLFMVLAFVLATGASALACWYYGLPLGLSLLGGFIVLGITLALKTDSLFD